MGKWETSLENVPEGILVLRVLNPAGPGYSREIGQYNSQSDEFEDLNGEPLCLPEEVVGFSKNGELYFEPENTDECCGCGYCCLKAMCALGVMVFGAKKECPSLYFEGGRFWCRLAKDLEIKRQLYIGEGCCSTLFNTQREAFLRGKGAEYLKTIGLGRLTKKETK